MSSSKPDSAAASQRESSDDMLNKVTVVAIALAVASVMTVYWLTGDKQRLARQYDIPLDKVVIKSEPHGCAFTDAPLGNKYCHYEKTVIEQKACPNCKVQGVYVSWNKVDE